MRLLGCEKERSGHETPIIPRRSLCSCSECTVYMLKRLVRLIPNIDTSHR